MLISNLVAATVLWYFVQSFPGILDALGYLFGILLATFMVDACLQRDRG